MEVFRENGYHETCFSRLVDELGVGRQSLYNTYGDKHTLFLKALDRYISENNHQRESILFAEGDPRERIRHFLTAIQHAVSESGCRACMVIHTAADLGGDDPEIQQRLRVCFNRLEEDLRKVFAEAESVQAFALPIETLTAIFVSQICALTVLHSAGYSADEIETQCNALLALL